MTSPFKPCDNPNCEQCRGGASQPSAPAAQPLSEQEEQCFYCKQHYPLPVSLHHTQEECLANQAKVKAPPAHHVNYEPLHKPIDAPDDEMESDMDRPWTKKQKPNAPASEKVQPQYPYGERGCQVHWGTVEHSGPAVVKVKDVEKTVFQICQAHLDYITKKQVGMKPDRTEGNYWTVIETLPVAPPAPETAHVHSNIGCSDCAEKAQLNSVAEIKQSGGNIRAATLAWKGQQLTDEEKFTRSAAERERGEIYDLPVGSPKGQQIADDPCTAQLKKEAKEDMAKKQKELDALGAPEGQPNEGDGKAHDAAECAAVAYQILGALSAPARILDYFSAIAQGELWPENPLPFDRSEIGEGWKLVGAPKGDVVRTHLQEMFRHDGYYGSEDFDRKKMLAARFWLMDWCARPVASQPAVSGETRPDAEQFPSGGDSSVTGIKPCGCLENGRDNTLRHSGNTVVMRLKSGTVMKVCANHLRNYLINDPEILSQAESALAQQAGELERLRGMNEHLLAIEAARGTKGRSGDTVCQVCSLPNIGWFVDSKIWRKVIKEGVGIYCLRCFAERAREQGLNPQWQLLPEYELIALQEKISVLEGEVKAAGDGSGITNVQAQFDVQMKVVEAECDRLRKEGERVDADAQKWMSRAALAEAEIDRLRDELMFEQGNVKMERDRAEEFEKAYDRFRDELEFANKRAKSLAIEVDGLREEVGLWNQIYGKVFQETLAKLREWRAANETHARGEIVARDLSVYEKLAALASDQRGRKIHELHLPNLPKM
jgi:hypothetical protein